MTPQELKNSILQRAIQGKLVEQRPEEGTGEELYKQIQAEKAGLIKEGKLKKEKPLPPISEDEIPFDIPETWKWVRLGELGTFVRGNGIKRDETRASGCPCIRYGQLYTTYRNSFNETVSFVDKTLYDNCQKVMPNDVVMALTGENNYDIALATAYLGTIPVAMGGDMTKFSHSISSMYLVYTINSSYAISCKSKLATGQIIVHISNDKLSTIPIPLPPLAEQKRIVAKIEELLPLVEQYEKAYNRLEQLNKQFPNDMKKSILQLAMQGKLVEQRPEEGTGEELYKQIQAEKARLIKDGKIKKEKPLPPISEDEIPFDIPESWKWCYLGEIFNHNTGKAQNSSDNRDGVVRKFITTSNLYWNRFDFSHMKEMRFTEQEIERCSARKGDMLVCEGGDYGRAAIWGFNEEVCFQNHVHRLRAYTEIEIVYFYHIFYLYKTTGQLKGRGVGIQGLSSGALHETKIPLPPLAEQKRIVAKIEELLPLCDLLNRKWT